MYIIYQSWYDSLTALHEPDAGYSVVGYVETANEAEKIVANGGIDSRPFTAQPMYKFELVEPFIKEQ